MAYQVLARKWRPQRFADVFGQQHITRTLQNAIQRQRVGHAYLFVGARGIGKTTSARIFAKALNCLSPDTDAEGRIEPCCTCQNCIEIANGNCLDVIEIDGASNNGVENIRELRETVQYAPTNGRDYKVYIIDEVHMLTAGAWNALLKTLEEPPAHVKFLFATTEAHKVLPTILSRCQRFDLKRLPVPVICQRLRQIADKEEVKISDDALTIIARAADGGMRDAQSSFDQMIAFCGGDETPIGEEDVVEVFGLTSSGELNRLARALLQNDAGTVVTAIHHLADKGRNLERFYVDTLGYLRNLMVFHAVSQPREILDVGESEYQELEALAGHASAQIVQRLVEGLLSNDGSIRYTLNKRVFLETTFLRVMREAHAMRVDDLIRQLKKLRENGDLDDLAKLQAMQPAPLAAMPPPQERPAAPPPPAPTPKAVEPPAASAPPPVAPQPPEPEVAPERPHTEPRPEAAPPPPPPVEVDEPDDDDEPDQDPPERVDQKEAYDDDERTDEAGDEQTDEEQGLPPLFPGLNLAIAEDEADFHDEEAAPMVTQQAKERVKPASIYIHSEENRHYAVKLWSEVVQRAHRSKLPGADSLEAVVPLAITEHELIGGTPQSATDEDYSILQADATCAFINNCLRELTPRHPLQLRLRSVLIDFNPGDREQRRQLVSTTEVWKRLESHPFVRQVMSLFEGQLVDVRG